MVDPEVVKHESLIKKASLKIDKDEKKMLSITKKIDKMDPLLFFSAAKKIASYRTFWTSTIDDFVLVGVGNLYEIETTENRYEQTWNAWQTIQDKAEVHNPFNVPGTGLVALGGMTFDPKKEKSPLWENYPDSQLHIPEFLLTKYNDQFYLTINTYLAKDDNPSMLARKAREKEQLLMTGSDTPHTNLTVKSKKEIEPEQWKQAVYKAREAIRQYDVEKIVMAREMRLIFSEKVDIANVLEKLLDTQPNSYIFAFDHGEDCFVGATPERLVKVEKEKMLSTCLAGTSPRGKTSEEDEELSRRFLHDEKNLQEHDFVVQMIRQGIEKYCVNIDIPKKPVVYKLKNLQHLYTPVKATLKNDATIFDIVKQLHPTPALGGTPTEDALSFIRSHELLDRGWYGAPIGWIDSNHYGEFVVAIRSGLIQGNEASLFAGCGIVEDSDIEEEYEETNMKFLPMLNVFQKTD